ncbi:MAG TPA: hypothetical protein VJ180_09395 [Pyrinomonadaceae bacterium]|nr:hypothetical protein [Pyrinomonadaceae bacterium]
MVVLSGTPNAQSTVTQKLERNSESNPALMPTCTVSFTTDEGTLVSVDVSPYAKTLVFDLVYWSKSG